MVRSFSDFALGEATAARAALAADLISAGKAVDLGGVCVRLTGTELEVAIYIDCSLHHGELSELRATAIRALTNVVSRWPALEAAMTCKSQRLVLLHNYGMGSTLLGHWVGDNFVPEPHALEFVRSSG